MDTKETVLVVDDDRRSWGHALALKRRATGCCVPMTAWRPWTHALDPELRLILMDVMMPRRTASPPSSASGNGATCPSLSCPPRARRATRCWGLSMGGG